MLRSLTDGGLIAITPAEAGLRLIWSGRDAHDPFYMSLNRSEQMMGDYVDENPEELRFWQDKVKRFAKESRDRHTAATGLAEELWAYFKERSEVVPSFREMASSDNDRPTSMRNLADYWLRLWAPLPPKKKKKLWPG